MRRMVLAAMWVTAALGASRAGAYPEFQAWVDGQTPRNVNCALCHAHGDGPDGVKPGQIGSLSPEQLAALNEARQAFEPGQQVDSPILNEFGDRMVEKLGRTGIIQLRQRPGDLPQAYGFESDLDGDGIPDAREYIEGTLATNAHHGDPWLLLRHNLKTNWWHLVLIAIATLLGLYGINNLLAWFEQAIGGDEEAAEGEAGIMKFEIRNSKLETNSNSTILK